MNEPGQTSEIVERVRKARQQANSAHGKWRDEATESYDFAAGNQWSEHDVLAAGEENRVLPTFNRIGRIVESVRGSEMNNRQEVRYKPRGVSDSGVNDVLTEVAKWARDQCNAEDEESDAFCDLLICGMGWTDTRMDYEVDEQGSVVIERIDPMEMRWDPDAQKANLADAKWVQREVMMSREEVEAQWPDKADQIGVDVREAPADLTTKLSDRRSDYMANGTETGYHKGKYRVIRHQWQESIAVMNVMDPMSGQITKMAPADFKTAKERLNQLMPGAGDDLKSAKTTKRVYRETYVCGGVELETADLPCQYGFTLQCMTGKRDRNHGTWFGLVRPAMDPQRWANKFLMLVLDIINKNAKGGIIVEESAVSNVRKFEDSWAKTDAINWVKPGGSAKITPKAPPIIPPAIADIMQFSVASVQDCPGVNLEMLGLADRQQAGVLERQRTQAGYMLLAPFFNAIRQYRKIQGKILAHFINEFMSDGRLVRIVGPEGEQFVPFVKQRDVLEYDVIVDVAPTSRDVKEQTWHALSQVLPELMKNGVPIPPSLIEYIPGLPSGLVQEWKNYIGNNDPQKAQAQQAIQQRDQQIQQMGQGLQQAQQQLQGLQMQLQATKDRSDVDMLKVQVDQFKAETDRLKAQAEANAPDSSMLESTKLEYEDRWKRLEADTKVLVAEIQSKTSLATSGAQLPQLDEAGNEIKKPGIEDVIATMNENLNALISMQAQSAQSGASLENGLRAVAETLARPKVARLSNGREIRVHSDGGEIRVQ